MAEFDAAVAVFKLLADPTRLRIIWALLYGEHSLNELADHVGAHPLAVSQHLSKLRLARLVRVRRDGNRVFYALENDHIERLASEALQHDACPPPPGLPVSCGHRPIDFDNGFHIRYGGVPVSKDHS